MNRYDRNQQLIYFGVLMSTLVYGVIIWATTNPAVPSKSLVAELRAPSTQGLYGVGAAALVFALVVRARPLLMMRWILLDVLCVCGLIAAFVQGDWRLYAIAWLPALVGLIALFPRVRMGQRSGDLRSGMRDR